MLIKHCFQVGKILFKQSNGLIRIIRTLFCRKQRLRGGVLTLNAVVQTQMILNAQVAQIRQLSRKTPKNSTNSFWLNVNRSWGEIEEDLKISEGSVLTVFHEHLSMKMLCSKWVLRLLTVDQKQQRVDDSECCLQLFQRNKKNFLRKYVIMVETWIQHSLRSQIGSQLSRQRQVKAVQSDQRRNHQQARFWPPYFGMSKVFCALITPKKGRTVNSEYY